LLGKPTILGNTHVFFEDVSFCFWDFLGLYNRNGIFWGMPFPMIFLSGFSGFCQNGFFWDNCLDSLQLPMQSTKKTWPKQSGCFFNAFWLPEWWKVGASFSLGQGGKRARKKKTNVSPKKGAFQKERIVFQPLFRGKCWFSGEYIMKQNFKHNDYKKNTKCPAV